MNNSIIQNHCRGELIAYNNEVGAVFQIKLFKGVVKI